MKFSEIPEEKLQDIRDALSKCQQDIKTVQAGGPEGCIPKVERICREMCSPFNELLAILAMIDR